MKSSALRNFAYAYLHFAAARSESWGGFGTYQVALIVFCLAVCAGLAMAVYSGKARVRLAPRLLCSAPVYGCTLLVALFAVRLPCFVMPQMNADEGMFLACARKLAADPVFWRSVDGATSGPLNFYALLVPWAFGFPLDFATDRFTNVLCLGGAVVCLYLAARVILPEWQARLGVLPIFGLLAICEHGDLISYSSECVSAFLTALAAWLVFTGFLKPRISCGRVFAAGAVAALLPLAKLQSTPVGAALGILALAIAISRVKQAGWRPVVSLSGGALAVGAALAAYLAVFGQFETFWQSYVINNIYYNSSAFEHVSWTPLSFTVYLLKWDMGFFVAALGVYSLGVGCLLCFRRSPAAAEADKIAPPPGAHKRKAGPPRVVDVPAGQDAKRRLPSLLPFHLFGLGLVAASLYAAYKPLRDFPHYQILTFMPFGLLSVLVFSAHLRLPPPRAAAWRSVVFLGVTLAVPLFLSLGGPVVPFGMALEVPLKFQCGVCDAIRHYAMPGDLVSIWGWEPDFFVATETVMASRDFFTYPQILKTPQREYYRARYLSDLKRHPPKVFVDAVGPEMFFLEHREKEGHETFPQLDEYIRSGFEFAGEWEGARIYARKDVFRKAGRFEQAAGQ
jgi:hypothetical protein